MIFWVQKGFETHRHVPVFWCLVSVSSIMSSGDSRLFSFPDCHSHSGTMSHHSSVPPSITSSHRAQSCLSCPSMHCPSSPHKPADMQSQTGRNGLRNVTQAVTDKQNFPTCDLLFCCVISPHYLWDAALCRPVSLFYLSFILLLWILLLLSAPASVFTSTSFHPPPNCSSTQRIPMPFHPHPTTLRTRYQGNRGVGFSLAEVHQELQMLQRQLGDSESASVELYKHECGYESLLTFFFFF